MKKPSIKTAFVCRACGHTASRWMGRCLGCGEWNTLEEERVAPTAARSPVGGTEKARPRKLKDIQADDARRIPTGISEFDRALGGGPVAGGVVLLGGEPGIGKSTLVMQAFAALAAQGHSALYITGEESAAQVALRARRLGIPGVDEIDILATTELEESEAALRRDRPVVAVIDSIQVLRSTELGSSAGSVTQLREVTARLVELAKQEGISLILIGHVTKDGAIAGPKLLEHLVDTVLSFEGDRSHAFRIIRATKNRFGAANEVGVFEMVEEGLREVPDPSALFLAERSSNASGSVIVPTAEGSRPLLVEVQALVAPAAYGAPRRVASGVDANRLAILLAVLERRAGLHVLDRDVFASIAGGVRVDERALDLALAVATVSSFRDRPVPGDFAIFGEIGLAGEIRAVQLAAQRVAEARKLGFRRVIMPALNAERLLPAERAGVEIVAVRTLEAAIEAALG
ncbi:MAG: DNA repair protein RadA [Sandaracinaceae bacterium]|nr:DNA repair protein RadA [Sandaracinaceae bacterium]